MKRTKNKVMQRTKMPAKNDLFFTFVKERKAYDAFQKSYYNIMLGNTYCGAIVKWKWSEPSLGQFRVRLLVLRKDYQGKIAPFEWVTIDFKFHTTTEAKQYVQDNDNFLQKQYKLFL